jgi:hypothetical protein
VEFTLRSLSASARGDVILNLNALEGNARVEGQSAEVLIVKAGKGKEKLELDSAFQLNMNVRYEAPKQGAETTEETATESTPAQN